MRRMNFGKMFDSGDVVLTRIQFSDSFEVKVRPALVLFNDFGNLVVCGITSNEKMEGISLLKKDGAMKDSVIKLNYIFTISENFILKKLFSIDNKKKKQVYEGLIGKLGGLKL